MSAPHKRPEAGRGSAVRLTKRLAMLCTGDRFPVGRGAWALVLLGAAMLCGCGELVVHDTASLLAPQFKRSEIVGMVAGFGTTFAAVPDLFAMLRRRSSKGMNPTMAGIMGVFQIVWVYYGLLIASRPVIAWNIVAVAINFLSVGAYFYFARCERNEAARTALRMVSSADRGEDK